jgi:hypothetical protein
VVPIVATSSHWNNRIADTETAHTGQGQVVAMLVEGGHNAGARSRLRSEGEVLDLRTCAVGSTCRGLRSS